MVLLSAFILLLFATFVAAAASITTQLNIETKVKSVHQDYAAIIIKRQQPTRQLQSFSITDMLTLTNSSCPTNCPLCDCTKQNFTSEDEELACTLNKSIEACSTNTFQSCYTDILNDTPFDIEGLCTVECSTDDGDGSAAVSPTSQGTSDNRALCQICNIFSCCTNCPSDKAAECFPSNIEDGYTPAGWEPLSCSDSSGVMVGGSWGWSALPLILLSISYVTSSFMLV